MKLDIRAPGHALSAPMPKAGEIIAPASNVLYAPTPESDSATKQMTVADLRAALNGLPDAMPVSVSYDCGCATMTVEVAAVVDGQLWFGDDMSLSGDGALFPATATTA